MSDEDEEEYINVCADIMSRLDYSAEQLRDFWNRYWSYSCVRMMAVFTAPYLYYMPTNLFYDIMSILITA